jgi:hypothetical protein
MEVEKLKWKHRLALKIMWIIVSYLMANSAEQTLKDIRDIYTEISVKGKIDTFGAE